MASVGDLHRRSRITIRLTAEERHALDAAADNLAVSLSDYVRCVLTGSPPLPAMRRPTIDASLLARVLVQLGAVASNLTPIAQAAIDTKPAEILTPFLERELLRSLSDLKTCRSRLFEALGRRERP